jgi:hypothetical protein
MWVNSQFGLTDGTSKARVKLPGIHIVGIILGIVDMFFGTVDTKALSSNFKLASGIAK